jgi:Leucine-rich repeat (LRR) protein
VELNLAENFIRVIENLSPLRNLLRLNLSGNQIKRIPGKIYPFLQKSCLELMASKKCHAFAELTPIGEWTHDIDTCLATYFR